MQFHSPPCGFECLKYVEILHPAKQSSQVDLEAVIAISIQDGCRLVKLSPYMGGGRKNKVSEHPGVFVGSANGSSVFPGRGRAPVQNEGAVRVSCCDSFSREETVTKYTPVYFGKIDWYSYNKMFLDAAAFEIILNI